MSILAWAERRTKAMTLWDIGVLKVVSVLFGMVVGAFMAGFVREHLWGFLVPMLVLGVGFGIRWFTAKAGGLTTN